MAMLGFQVHLSMGRLMRSATDNTIFLFVLIVIENSPLERGGVSNFRAQNSALFCRSH